jgi:hypothetical protein
MGVLVCSGSSKKKRNERNRPRLQFEARRLGDKSEALKHLVRGVVERPGRGFDLVDPFGSSPRTRR